MRAVWAFALLAALPGLLGGCTATAQRHATLQSSIISLKAGDLEGNGLAFITPSTVTGQEEDRQGVALTFSTVLHEQRPDVKCVTLPETLGAINRAGLADAYRLMYDEYRSTGMFGRSTLRRIGEATGTRYIAQLKLADFRQNTEQRFGALGIRMLQTKIASIRLFLQIWDSVDGSVAWEGSEEFIYSDETFSERSVTLKLVVEETAQHLVAKLP